MSGETAPRKIGRGYARNLDAGPFQPMIGSFDLHLRAEHKSPKTITIYIDAATWFASASLVPAGLTDWSAGDRAARAGVGRAPCWPATPTSTPTTSSARCSSSSSGTPPKTPTSRGATRWPA